MDIFYFVAGNRDKPGEFYMVTYSTIILKFDQQGEKTGWTYIKIPAEIAGQLQPGNKKSFRVKGKLDSYAISGVALLPMGGGDFIMPLKADTRKAIGKNRGATLKVQLTVDKVPYQIDTTFIECLADEPAASKYFYSLPAGHQNYFSKWIETAKTDPTKIKRIAQAVSALAKSMGFSEMVRAEKKDRETL
ncbi:MAG: YdeI/OmpD-associated family protein [Ferruginibacter sp.]